MDSRVIAEPPRNVKTSITTIIEAMREVVPDAEVYLFGSFAKDA